MAMQFNLNDGGSNLGGQHPQGAHAQTEDELKKHLEHLVLEYKSKHPVPPNASRLIKERQKQKAMEWAVQEEPKRNLPYVLESMQGVKADTEPRDVNGVHYTGRSSCIEYITQPDENQIRVKFRDNPKVYNFDAYPRNVEKLLKSKSIGSEISNAVWHTGNTSGVSSHGDRHKGGK